MGKKLQKQVLKERKGKFDLCKIILTKLLINPYTNVGVCAENVYKTICFQQDIISPDFGASPL